MYLVSYYSFRNQTQARPGFKSWALTVSDLYINDIINSSHILSFVLIADDTTKYVQHDSIEGAIQILNSELDKSSRMD